MLAHPNLRILIVDDNPKIHEDFIGILSIKSTGNDELKNFEKAIFGQTKTEDAMLPAFEIDTALQGQEAVNKIDNAIKENTPYALAFVDIRMPPGWDGIETIKHIWTIDPNIQIVICTAYSDYSWEETINQLGKKDNLLILKKPFDNTVVRQLACALTKKWLLMRQIYEHSTMLEERVKERTHLLQQSLSITRGTLESTADGILVVNNTNELIDWNGKLMEMWGIPQSIFDNKQANTLFEYISTKIVDPAEITKIMTDLANSTEGITFGQIKCIDKSIYEYYSQPYKIEDKLIGRIWSFRNNTNRIMLEESLQYQATHDSLTGLPNRAFLHEHFHTLIDEARRANAMLGVLFFDLDRFKLINDSFNHLAGDKLLKITARRLMTVMRREDILVRLGGDEFVAVITSIKDKDNLMKIATKLLHIFRDPFKLREDEVSVTSSMGACVFPEDGNNIDELLRNADTAMYQAKRNGGNRVEFYNNELSEKNLNDLRLETDLRRAIENNEFFLCYQPQVKLLTNELTSVEALIRWHHPQKGIIHPIKFIPIAEQTGLIVQIGEWALRNACLKNKYWQDQGFPPIRIAVNVSSLQLKDPLFIKKIKKILQETKLDPKYLELELTENSIINDDNYTQAMILELKNIGLHLAIDDFGSGYSALNYLRNIPVDRLKIDQSFVQNIDVNTANKIIIQAIITMAKGLNLEVLAEGVETQAQLDFLSSKKCEEIQGFYCSQPLSDKDLENLFRQRGEKEKM